MRVRGGVEAKDMIAPRAVVTGTTGGKLRYVIIRELKGDVDWC